MKWRFTWNSEVSFRMRKDRELPRIGDLVKLRGRVPHGVLRSVDDRLWSVVEWVSEVSGPKFCHLHELEVIR